MLVRSRIAERMFGSSEVLVAAIKLTEMPGVFVDEEVEKIEYFHLLLDSHMTIVADGAPSESLFTGVEALKALGADARQELFSLFPEIQDVTNLPETCRLVPDNGRQKSLIARHLKNNKPLLSDLAGS